MPSLMGDIEELRESDTLDSYLAKALNDYLDELDEEEEDDEY